MDLSSLPPHLAEALVGVAATIDQADQARADGDREEAERLLRGAVESVVDPYRQLAEERLGTLLSENGEVEEAVALWLRAAEGPDPGLRQAVKVYLGSIPFSDARFLVNAEPATVQALIPQAWGFGRLGAAVYQASAHRHRDACPAVRRQLLALDAARYGEPELAARIDAVPVADEGSPRRRVEWASGTQLGGCRWSVAGHPQGVSAVAVGAAARASVVVTGGDDGTVCLWDLATGDPVGEPMADHTGPVYAVATADLDGRPVALSAGTDQDVRIWDLTTHRLLHPPLAGHTDWVTGVATAALRGRPVAVTCGDDRSVRVWDLATGDPVGRPMSELADRGNPRLGRLTAVATTELGRRTVAVTGDFAGTVRVWDLEKGRQLRRPLATGTGAVQSLAVLPVGGRPTAVVGGSDGTATLWDLETGAQVGESLAGSTPWDQTVAAAQTGAGPVVVTSDHTGIVRLWDPATGRQTAQAFAGPLGETRALALTVTDGRPVVLVGTDDGRVHRWDPATDGRPVGHPLPGHGAPVTAVTAVTAVTTGEGTTVVVSASWDETVRLWDLATGAETGLPLTGDGDDDGTEGGYDEDTYDAEDDDAYDDENSDEDDTDHGYGGGDAVRALATAVIDGRPVVLTAWHDTELRLWDPASGTLPGNPLPHDAEVDAVATATLDGRPVAVTGSTEGDVRVWDLTTGEDLHGPLTGHESEVIAVATTTIDGRPVAVTADEETVRLWDLASGAPIGTPLGVPLGTPLALPEAEDTPCIETLATALVDGRPVVAVGSDDGLVHLWDLTTRALTGPPLRTADDGPTALTTTQVAGRPALITGTTDGTVRTWDLATLDPIGPDLVLPFPVHALATAPADRLIVGFGWEVGVFRLLTPGAPTDA
ncbi:hypothetical protein [Streptomyces sp. 1331.2]|uniref:hypothetical protein n=1 Tax=Streptomyces sp. 1331.2 TaxID=1938835 RepID=UPI000BD41689|nr:hypothetical protein [Streptomyces sp. 1331.2]SOB89039.1 WD40 repeat [Streptomyces sp. 1331.2]